MGNTVPVQCLVRMQTYPRTTFSTAQKHPKKQTVNMMATALQNIVPNEVVELAAGTSASSKSGESCPSITSRSSFGTVGAEQGGHVVISEVKKIQ